MNITSYLLRFLFINKLLFLVLSCGNSVEEASKITPNLAPSAKDDAVYIHRNAIDVEISVLANDRDPDDGNISLVSFTQGTLGSVTQSTKDSAVVLVYNPEVNQSGVDTFTYNIRDKFGKNATATVTVGISAWGAPLYVGEGKGVDLATSLEGNAVAVWANGASVYSNRFLLGSGWQSGLSMYTANSPGIVQGQRITINGIGQVLAVWKSIESNLAQLGYGVVDVDTTPNPQIFAVEAY